jgi:nicotinamidase/pyrazinamidase
LKPAIIVVDMLKDSFNDKHRNPVTPFARSIVPHVNRLLGEARRRSIPVIFSMDSFLPGDFIFGGKMKEHSLRGTAGAEVADELDQCPTDYYSSKRRFSAFFKTDLDQTLRLLHADTAVITGINSHWCVLGSALDALAHDFRAIILEDCCASYSLDIHETTMNLYRKNPLYPLFQILTLDAFLKELNPDGSVQ